MKRFSCIALLLAASSAALFAQRKIDDAALKNAAKTPEEWLSYGFTPGETRYVPIDQINTSNVSRLGLAWQLEVGKGGGNQEATPLVWNNTIFNITNWSIVYAVDAVTGTYRTLPLPHLGRVDGEVGNAARPVALSPNGRRLAYPWSRREGYRSPVTAVAVVDLVSGRLDRFRVHDGGLPILLEGFRPIAMERMHRHREVAKPHRELQQSVGPPGPPAAPVLQHRSRRGSVSNP